MIYTTWLVLVYRFPRQPIVTTVMNTHEDCYRVIILRSWPRRSETTAGLLKRASQFSCVGVVAALEWCRCWECCSVEEWSCPIFLIISRCERGQSKIMPYSKTLLKGILKRNTAVSAMIGIRQHKIMIHICDFFMGKPPVFPEKWRGALRQCSHRNCSVEYVVR